MRDWNEWGIWAPRPVAEGAVVDFVFACGHTAYRYVVGSCGVFPTQQGGSFVVHGVGPFAGYWSAAVEAWRYSDDDAEGQRERYAQVFDGLLKVVPARETADV